MSKKSPLKETPVGWYVLAESNELKPGEVLSRKFVGREVVLFRTHTGEPSVVDAYCPHLGAHLGQGGTVEGETIRCPFHGFCFNTKGDCVTTGYGTKPPPKAKLGAWPTHEVNGLVMAWYHPAGEAPEWETPALDWDGWLPTKMKSYDLSSHPQETSENSVDTGHFAAVHGYKSVETLKPLRTEGPYLTTKYAMSRHADFLGFKGGDVRAEFEIHIHGLGYSMVEAYVPQYNLHSRHFVLPTPTEDGRISLRLGVSLLPTHLGKVNFFLGLMPNALGMSLLHSMYFKHYLGDVMQDFHIWENKCYIDPPVLAKGDGPIGKYRRWVKQFYPQPESTLTAVS